MILGSARSLPVSERDLDDERARRADSGVSGAALKEIFDAQAKTFATAIRGSTDKRSSTIRIQPTSKPPILGDEGKSSRDITEFFDKFDDMCNLANDGKGMLPQERLQTLSTCLKGTKEKIYKLLVAKHRKLGTLERDPDKVFGVIRTRLMRFSESDLERQMRVKGEWDQLWKG